MMSLFVSILMLSVILVPAHCATPRLRGDAYMVSMEPSRVYNLLTLQHEQLTIDARLSRLSAGSCLPGHQDTVACWSDVKAYIDSVRMQYRDSSIVLESGPMDSGFSEHSTQGTDLGMVLESSSRVRVRIGQLEFVFENRDRFISIVNVAFLGKDERSYLQGSSGLLVQ